MRIIAGRLGGRDLGSVPKGVRPTSDRVRESLFSVLGPTDGLVILDLFAGTGAFGLEAISRGAQGVVFVDHSRQVVRELEKRILSLGLDRTRDSIQILNSDAQKAIHRLSKKGQPRFDLVFVDPPYEEGDRAGILDALFASTLLKEGARVVVEGPKRHPLSPQPGRTLLDARDYGDTKLTWLEASKHDRPVLDS
ncbi:MAG TPA: 16S rRNA (guanine(966)-N(2))-methyltransferase RsmD [Myxococcales bacterium]|nr:16S rRNA (guanine(966)-N(2))-methyltransferase RsmD [Myxococcales bacterium]HIK86844.1 16S rRNA (guanine(966)-N(2))-methyltransferase RsmD [Myxococcales bacterium]